MVSYIFGYINGQTSEESSKNVVIYCQIDRDTISDLNRDDIVEPKFAEYNTCKIAKVIYIEDKHGNTYKNAVNIYRSDDFEFVQNSGLVVETPLQFYLDKQVSLSHQIDNKIKSVVKYADNGAVYMKGFVLNGFFTGIVASSDSKSGFVRVKNGVILENIEVASTI